jgi:hypothetical protein
MRIGEQDCDEICKRCEKENDPLWCLEAMFEMIKDNILQSNLNVPEIKGTYKKS